MKIVLAVIAIVCGIGWLKSRISTHALILYLLGKEYTPPSKAEMEACCKVAARRMFGLSS